MADRVGVMRAGQLEQLGSPAEVYSTPATNFVAEFVGSVSRLPGQVAAPGFVDVLGSRLAVPARGGVAPAVGSRVDVLVRPESIRIRPAVNGSAVVRAPRSSGRRCESWRRSPTAWRSPRYCLRARATPSRREPAWTSSSWATSCLSLNGRARLELSRRLLLRGDG